MRRFPVLLFLFVLGAAPSADAAVRTVSLTAGPYKVHAFDTQLPKVKVRTPKLTGYIRHMNATLVDRNGRPVSIKKVMLHHLVFINDGAKYGSRKGSCAGRFGEPFWGTGEERQQLLLPSGYGYPIQKTDKWRMQTMLMSHGPATRNVYVKYTMRIVTGQRLRPVKPYWIRANGCESRQPSYTVPGRRGPGSSSARTYDWRVPMSGRIVAAGGHLHGGAKDMFLTEPRCGDRRLLDNRPLYGAPEDPVYRLKPTLHEPGPIGTRYFLSGRGITVRRGHVLRLTGVYDGEHARPRVMSIMHVYVARSRRLAKPCAALPADRRHVLLRRGGRTAPPYVRVPFTMYGADGKLTEMLTLPGDPKHFDGGATVALRGNVFSPAKISIPRGSKLTWRFDDDIEHNVMYTFGPEVFGTASFVRPKRHTVTLRRPGTYQFFCYLHPVTMHEEVIVR